MKICVFDTETTSLDKPFCYNVGYVVIDTEDWSTLCARSYVVEQVWHNLPLFQSAYYAEKRPLYVAAMRARTTVMDKFGYICRQMARDFRNFDVEIAFAFNSSFDEKVFNFNCDWYKCNNPFDTVPIKDIRGFVHSFIVNDNYKEYCERFSLFTDSGNYSTTAETVYKFLFNDDFTEDHTALSDARIEAEILRQCVAEGANLREEYKALRSIEREEEKTLHIKTAEQIDYYFDYRKIRINKGKTEITLR